jgi:RimJ/RimL family protein N-acetyltransferase
MGAYYIKCPQVVVLSPDKNTVFICIPRSGTIWEVHMAILPESRGKKGIELGRKASAWMFENVPNCLNITAYIPEFNKPVQVYARLCGFEKVGILNGSFLKDGMRHNQIIFQRSKPCHLS